MASVDNIFNVIGGKPRSNRDLEGATNLGRLFGQLDSEASFPQFVNNIVKARNQQRAADQQSQLNSLKIALASDDLAAQRAQGRVSDIKNKIAQLAVSNPEAANQIIGRIRDSGAGDIFGLREQGTSIADVLSGALSQSQATQGSQGLRVVPDKIDSSGNVSFKFENPQSLQREAAAELNKKQAGKLAEILPKLEIAETALDNLIGTFNQAIPELAETGGEAIFSQGPSQTLAKLVGRNEKLRAFDQAKKAFSGVFAKGVFQESGVLTNQDIKRALDSLPNQFDSQESADIKIGILKDLINKAKLNFQNKRDNIAGDTEVRVQQAELELSKMSDEELRRIAGL